MRFCWPKSQYPKHIAQNSGRAGHTLAEVVVAVLILMIVASAFYAALSFGFGLMDTTRQELRATQILTQKAETLRLCTWEQLGNFSFSDTYDPQAGSTQSKGTIFSGTVSTNAASAVNSGASYKPNMRLVTIDLYWTNYCKGKRIVQNRTFRTEVARYGIQNYIWGAP